MNERKIALQLHSLSKSDRKWLLKSLPQEEKMLLNMLLRELDTLGIPKVDIDTLTINSNGRIEQKSNSDLVSDDKKEDLLLILDNEPPVVREIMDELLDENSDGISESCHRLGITTETGQYLLSSIRRILDGTG